MKKKVEKLEIEDDVKTKQGTLTFLISFQSNQTQENIDK